MRLERYSYADDCTRGKLTLASGAVLHTLERPWKPGMPGGMPRESCVPDGAYRLRDHIRPNGDRVLALSNPDLAVYYTDDERPAGAGRYLILFHAANWAHELHGCIAPGVGQMVQFDERDGARPMVTSSRAAMTRVMEAFDAGDTELIIEPTQGTA